MANLHSPKNPFRCEINYVKPVKGIGSVQSFSADSVNKCHVMARTMVANACVAANVTIMENSASYPEFDWRKVMSYDVAPSGKATAIIIENEDGIHYPEPAK